MKTRRLTPIHTLLPLLVLTSLTLSTGCASMNVRDRDLACAINDLVQARCVEGSEKNAELCAISKQLQAKCLDKEGKAALFSRLKSAMVGSE